jgi:tRNA(Ile)-lysidine synthase
MKKSEVFSVLEPVLKAIIRYNMLTPGSRVIAAVSGGADSVCLLHVLREVAPEFGAELAGVAHFNHKLRGDASDDDERCVAVLAARFGVAFYREGACIGEVAGNLEQEGRRARREFFAKLMHEGKGNRVALGHTRDDQAETVLFRIVRGSGLTGLAGIHPATSDGLIRPLIQVTRAEIETYLTDRGIAWREDATNRDLGFARNRIRHQLLPQLARDWNPKITAALANLGDLAFEEERWWNEQVPAIEVMDGAIEVRQSELAAMPRALARRWSRRAIAIVKGDLRSIDFDHIEGILEARDAGVPGIAIERSFDWLRIAPAGETARAIETMNVQVPGTYPAGENSTIRLEHGEAAEPPCVNLKAERVSSIPMVLRGWQPGDHYRPQGKSRDQKLKEMFQTARVPSWRRHRWPILECGGKILWTRGFGVAEEFSANSGRGPVIRIWDTALNR